jgi:DNA-binding transcriptional ArsR family regulator
METQAVSRCLEALGSPTRLEIFRLLVQAGPQGAVVGDLQAHLDIPPSTLSHHLSRLVRVGLVYQERRSRTLVCRADYARMNALLAFLSENCCEGLASGNCLDSGAA